MQKEYNESEHLSFKDESNQKHGLKGVVQIYRKNKETGEISFWDESTNIIPISGYDVILMKLFGLFLDSSHGKVTDNLTRDTNLAIPDLNERLHIGVKPENYTVMDEDIASDYICQGFMIGNGGAGEDSVTTKNTAYSFISLRNPIPFQQELNISPSIAGKYLGIYHENNGNADGNLLPQSAYIKKFDERPHLYHSWWVDGQRWDYIDPVSQDYLGPDSINGAQKTNRIETYVECKLSLSDTDCQRYFEHVGNTQTAMINELGLVAFDTIPGQRSVLETSYSKLILPMLELWARYQNYGKGNYRIITTTHSSSTYWKKKDMLQFLELVNEIYLVMMNPSANFNLDTLGIEQLSNFQTTIKNVWDVICTSSSGESILTQLSDDTLTDDQIDALWNNNASVENIFRSMNELYEDDNIQLMAYYNQNHVFVYSEDQFMTLIQNASTSDLTLDEAQRIKLVTYYTFNSIPISKNWEILINYRIYAN